MNEIAPIRRIEIELRARADVSEFPYVDVCVYPLALNEFETRSRRLSVKSFDGWIFQNVYQIDHRGNIAPEVIEKFVATASERIGRMRSVTPNEPEAS